MVELNAESDSAMSLNIKDRKRTGSRKPSPALRAKA
jgi:hypothetical protein